MNALLRLLLPVYHFILHMIAKFREIAIGRQGKRVSDSRGSPRGTSRRHQDQDINVATLEAALEDSNQALDRQRKRTQRLHGQLKEEQDRARSWQDKFQGADAEIQELRARLSEAEAQAKGSAGKLSELQRANAHLEKERRDTAALLETRTSELKEAQAFLTKADDVSDSELLRMVDALNSKIFQTATSLAEAPQLRYGSEDFDVAERAAQKLERDGFLEPHILSALRSINHTHDPLLVQTALQASMTMYVRWLAMSWDLGYHDPEGLLSKLYTEVRRRVPQSVAGRWRALCREAAKGVAGVGDAEPARHAKKLARLASDVLVACCASGSSDAIHAAVKAGFLSSFHEIIERALEFQRITGEVILSCDLITVVATPGTPFDPARMDDEWADPQVPSTSGQVLCTTQLGLMREERKSKDVQAMLLRKPKVVLRSMLETLWEEMSGVEGGLNKIPGRG